MLSRGGPWTIANHNGISDHADRNNTNEQSDMCEAWIDRCDAVDNFYEQFQDRQMSKTLYVLTLVTVLVMPTQLLTGVYGPCARAPGDG